MKVINSQNTNSVYVYDETVREACKAAGCTDDMFAWCTTNCTVKEISCEACFNKVIEIANKAI